jgi:hypothetical protein
VISPHRLPVARVPKHGGLRGAPDPRAAGGIQGLQPGGVPRLRRPARAAARGRGGCTRVGRGARAAASRALGARFPARAERAGRPARAAFGGRRGHARRRLRVSLRRGAGRLRAAHPAPTAPSAECTRCDAVGAASVASGDRGGAGGAHAAPQADGSRTRRASNRACSITRPRVTRRRSSTSACAGASGSAARRCRAGCARAAAPAP